MKISLFLQQAEYQESQTNTQRTLNLLKWEKESQYDLQKTYVQKDETVSSLNQKLKMKIYHIIIFAFKK